MAPLVTIVYRKGWYLTPDDLVSPYGAYEPTMRAVYAKYGKWIGDWVWLGFRNKGYGLKYKMTPDLFKVVTSYEDLNMVSTEGKYLRVIDIEGYKEYCLKLKYFHVLYGYRLRPVRDGIWKTPNMDARPIFSIRGGAED